MIVTVSARRASGAAATGAAGGGAGTAGGAGTVSGGRFVTVAGGAKIGGGTFAATGGRATGSGGFAVLDGADVTAGDAAAGGGGGGGAGDIVSISPLEPRRSSGIGLGAAGSCCAAPDSVLSSRAAIINAPRSKARREEPTISPGPESGEQSDGKGSALILDLPCIAPFRAVMASRHNDARIFRSAGMRSEQPSLLPRWVPTFSRLSGFIWSVKIALAAGGLPNIGLYFNGGIGDDIMCTAVARELKKRGAGVIWQLTRHAELFAGNPDISAVPADFRLRRLCQMFGRPCIELEYPEAPPRHLIAIMCEAAGIEGEVELRPLVMLTEAERRAGKLVKRQQIAIQTSNQAARFPMRNKLWAPERFDAVARALRDQFDLVQVGAPSDPVLDGVVDLRGKTSLRETAAILSASRVFIGLVGGLMHLARAVDCRSVIVYGGREHPSQSGYSANENLYWSGACSPCWLRNDCAYDRICMSEITPDQVITAVHRQSERYGTPLVVDRVTVPAKALSAPIA